MSVVALAVGLSALSGPPAVLAYGSNDFSSQLNFYRSDVRGDNQPLKVFATQSSAHKYCPKDMVVWLNTDTNIWVEPGESAYGKTPHGKYVCRKQAALAHKRHHTVTH
jgi:hypothetical protein